MDSLGLELLNGVVRACRKCYMVAVPGTDYPKIIEVEVIKLLAMFKFTPRMVKGLYRTFQQLRAYDPLTANTSADECCVANVHRLVRSCQPWTERLLNALLELGGFTEIVPWQGFLFVLLRFCSLSRLELAQVMFYIISREQKSWTVHYVTAAQLESFYSMYQNCPVKSFDTSVVDFTGLSTAKVRIIDFIHLTYRYSQLLNPCIHLQRSIQQRMPSVTFWRDFDRVPRLNQHITLEFFRYQRCMNMLEVMEGALKQQEMIFSGKNLTKPEQHMMNEEGYHGTNTDEPTQIVRFPKVHSDTLLPLVGPGPPGMARLREFVPSHQRQHPTPAWMESQVMTNEDPLRGTALGTAAIPPPLPHWMKPLEKSITVSLAKEVITGTHRPGDFVSSLGRTVNMTTEYSEKSRDITRVKELDFIATSRLRPDRQYSVLKATESVRQYPLIKRSDGSA